MWKYREESFWFLLKNIYINRFWLDSEETDIQERSTQKTIGYRLI